MEVITKFLVENNIGDWASIGGLFITIIGFTVTIINVYRSKRAAEMAQFAVQKVRDDILRIDMVAEFSAALSIMEEIKRLHRHQAWPILLDRYSALRKSLISIKTSYPNLLEDHKISLQNAAQRFSGIEKKVELAMAKEPFIIDIAKLNKTVSAQIDSLYEVLVQIKINVGSESNGKL